MLSPRLSVPSFSRPETPIVLFLNCRQKSCHADGNRASRMLDSQWVFGTSIRCPMIESGRRQQPPSATGTKRRLALRGKIPNVMFDTYQKQVNLVSI